MDGFIDKHCVFYSFQENVLSEMGFFILVACLASALAAVMPFQEMNINSEVSIWITNYDSLA